MKRLTIASNQGEIAGGEVMLFALAEAARSLGHEVTVVAPRSPSAVVEQSRERLIPTVGIDASSPREYLVNLRRWDSAHRQGLLWCNGLRPAFATTGHRNRVVHLHQEPVGRLTPLSRVARLGSLRTVVPSADMARRVPDTLVLENWTNAQPARSRPPRAENETPVIGYLGRLSTDKGVPVLARATAMLIARGRPVRLLLAGEPRFVEADDAARVEASLAPLGDAVVRPGWMDRSEFFDSVDLAVFPSVWAEPFGLVVAEAMGAGCPFVISNAGALPEVVGTDYPHVAQRGDAEALADAIEAALDQPSEACVRRSYERWATSYSPVAGQERMRTLLDELTKAEGRS